MDRSVPGGSISIAALTDHRDTPSSRFRIRQLIPRLLRYGINVQDFPRRFSTQTAGRFFPASRIRNSPLKMSVAISCELRNLNNTMARVARSRAFDAAWVSRELMIGYPSFERLLNDNCFYDIDDAVYLSKGIRKRGIDSLIRRARRTFAGNKYLAEYCLQHSDRVLVVPTAVDTSKFVPSPTRRDSDKFVVGWSGTSSSFGYFAAIERTLAAFFDKRHDAVLRICSDRFPAELGRLRNYIQFRKWTAADEVAQIQEFDVGIMPLVDSDWVKGKCSYKMLLYASCGVPSIVSPVGMNKDVLELGKIGLGCETSACWFDALEFAYGARAGLGRVFPESRRIVEENFSIASVSRVIATAMKAG